MPNVLIVSDSPAVAAEVQSVLSPSKDKSAVVTSGSAALETARAGAPDIIVSDFQVGNMGGMAICMDIRLDQTAGKPEIPVLLLLDRRADVFLARRSHANGWVIKPTDPIRLRKAIETVLRGERYEDDSYKPSPVSVSAV